MMGQSTPQSCYSSISFKQGSAHMSMSMSDKLFSVEDVLLYLLSFLSPEDLVQAGGVSTSFLSASRRDILWKPLCFSELNLTALTDVPPVFRLARTRPVSTTSPPSLPRAPSFFYLFRQWALEFPLHLYRRADVRAMSCWWTQLEEWLEEHAPPLLATLNPPASEADFSHANAFFLQQQITDPSGNITTLPYLLRLMYRFHDGQVTLFDPDVMMDRSFIRTSLLGLFGGTNFFSSQVCMRLLPIREVVSMTAMVCSHLRGKSRSHPPCSLFRHTAEDETSPFDTPSAPSTSIEGCVVFSTSILDFQKLYCVGPDSSCVVADGPGQQQQQQQSGSVFVSNSAWGLTPCHPQAVEQSQQYLLLWLQEYLRRLQRGVYVFQPPDLSLSEEDKRLLPPEERNASMISLYPLQPLYDEEDMEEDAYTGGESLRTGTSTGTRIGSRSTCQSRHNLGATRCVTRNIEVVACPAYIPEKSNPARNSFFWSYSIRLRMLTPSDPGYDIACTGSCSSWQLSTRHWKVFEPKGESPEEVGGHTEEMDGDGVIGLYPLLSMPVPSSSPSPSSSTGGADSVGTLTHLQNGSQCSFAYQSCSTASSFPGSFRGHMRFIPGSREGPTGAPFDVHLSEFQLSIPDFIY